MNQETLYFDERTGEMRFADVRSCRPSGRPSEAPSQPAAEPVSTPVKPRTPRGKKPKAPQGEPKPLVLQIPEQWRRFVREQLWRPAEVALQYMPSERRERWEAAVRLLARLSDGEAVPTPEAPAQPPEASEPAAETDSAKLDTTLFRPSKHPEHLLPTLTSKGKRAVLRMLQEAPGGRLPEEEIRRRLRLPHVPFPSKECFYQSGDRGGEWVLKETSKKSAAKVAPSKTKAPPKKLRAPRPTKTIREAKPKMLDGYDTKTWAEGLHSVAGLINANGTTRGAWLLLHANPNTNVAAEVLDLLGQAGLVVPGETIKIGAVLQADLDAQPSARLSYLLTRRVGEWVCELVASSPSPPTVDALAKLTGLHRGLFCALLNALESEGRVRRSKGSRVPVWVVSAQDRTPPLFEGVEPAPEREAAE